MKRTLFLTILLAICLCCSPKTNQPSTASGYISLFNGKNLDGWVGNKTDYKVIDGSIVITPESGGRGNLYTAEQYSNFMFKFMFKLTPGANNGLGIHAPLDGDAAYLGKEIQILDNTAEKYANLKEYQYHGSLYGIAPAKKGALKPVGQWNEEVVTVKDDYIKVELNGQTILEGNHLVPGNTIDGNDHPGLGVKKGHIGFLGHGDEVHFKEIFIKKL